MNETTNANAMAISTQLQAVQSRLKAPKGQYNKFGKYRYRSCEDILQAAKPILAELGLSLVLTDDLLHVGDRFYVQAKAMLMNGVGETVCTTAFAREEDEKKGMDGSQITGTASSYARKYALNGLFCIDDTKDMDTLNDGRFEELEKEDTQDEISRMRKEAQMAAVKATDRKTLTEVWNRYRQLQCEDAFISLIQRRAKELEK